MPALTILTTCHGSVCISCLTHKDKANSWELLLMLRSIPQ